MGAHVVRGGRGDCDGEKKTQCATAAAKRAAEAAKTQREEKEKNRASERVRTKEGPRHAQRKGHRNNLCDSDDIGDDT